MSPACIRTAAGVVWIGTPGYGIFTYDPRIERFHTQLASSIGWMAPLSDGRVALVSGLKVKVCDPQRSVVAPAPPLLVEGERQGILLRPGRFIRGFTRRCGLVVRGWKAVSQG
jgi:hypothetical protein